MNFGELAGRVMAASEAAETEVVAVEQHESLTRFANNSIHQNVTERNTQIIVRAVIGTRVGIAISNDERPDSLKHLARRAGALAKLQPENPDFKGLPKPQPIVRISAFDEATAACSPDERASRVKVICSKAASAACHAAGSVTTLSSHIGVANSHGVFGEFRSTLADASTVIMGSSSSGWAQATALSMDRIDTGALADEALRKVRMGAEPKEFEPGQYAVILDPYATSNLVEMLAFDGMSALAFQEGRSWMNGRIGEKIMADSVTITDDGLDASGLPMPFDFEGTPKRSVPIIKRGVAKTPVYDTFTAGREPDKSTTGHAIPPSTTEHYGPLPMNLFLHPGSDTVESMIRSTKLGIYITRFWYTVPVHPRDAVMTGMTRDGTFLVRDGEIVHPIKSLRFTQSYVRALYHAEAIGSTTRLLRFGMGAGSVPAIKLAEFSFTSSTR
jgi:predicted Zn-dependent protease